MKSVPIPVSIDNYELIKRLNVPQQKRKKACFNKIDDNYYIAFIEPLTICRKRNEYKAAVTSGCELDFVCSPCSKKEQTHRSEADIDVDDFAANWEMGFNISDIHDNVTDEDLDSTRAEGNGNVDDDGAIDGDHITGNEMDDTTGNGDDDGDIDGPQDME
ncbi:hypothetical protein DPMN_017704 [Dreissena polymorpha]|uniref:Uncharacterized protein n=1 Tax=Dreissena polymorpha TaxID=45954 RepID=A0A9D4NF66_DREPO|nr:hypothetical protein DPMN_017704 [Dreissena polymorpha]